MTDEIKRGEKDAEDVLLFPDLVKIIFYAIEIKMHW